VLYFQFFSIPFPKMQLDLECCRTSSNVGF
jgi:hypothetical protein